MKCDPPENVEPSLMAQLKKSHGNKALYLAIIEAIDELAWKDPVDLSERMLETLGGKGNFKTAIILGARDLGAVIHCEDFEIGMIYLTPGTFYPPHAHDAIELYHPVIGDALWGPSKKYLKPVD